MYGPVRTVVQEGSGREACPYPNCARNRRAGDLHVSSRMPLIPAFTISNDYMGVGVPKGETRLLGFVNDTLKGLEANGRAGRIYDAWFGPTTKTPLTRIFRIGDKT